MKPKSFIARLFSLRPGGGKARRELSHLTGKNPEAPRGAAPQAAAGAPAEPLLFGLDAPLIAPMDFTPIGEALRAARLARGLTVEDIVAVTRVRRMHVAALEDMDLSKLPSRPFVVGYIHAYAKAVGMDENEAVARFRRDAPLQDEDLPEPIGVDSEDDPRRGLIIAAGMAVFAAIFIWNIAQRAIDARQRSVSNQQVERADIKIPQPEGAITLGQPLPPPTEATLPAPYITPGLDQVDPVAAAAAAAAARAQVAANPVQPRPFVARGQIYGVPAGQPNVLLKAANEVTLMIRHPGGAVDDVRILKAGEAYRAPLTAGLVVDVSMPSSVEYYEGGFLRGTLVNPVTPVTQLAHQP